MEEIAVAWTFGTVFCLFIAIRYAVSYYARRSWTKNVDKELSEVITGDEHKVKGRFE